MLQICLQSDLNFQNGLQLAIHIQEQPIYSIPSLQDSFDAIGHQKSELEEHCVRFDSRDVLKQTCNK